MQCQGNVHVALAVKSNRSIPALDRWSSLECANERRDNQQHEEDEEQDLGNFRRGAGNAREAEEAGNHGDNEEYQGPSKHISSGLRLVERN